MECLYAASYFWASFSNLRKARSKIYSVVVTNYDLLENNKNLPRTNSLAYFAAMLGTNKTVFKC
jgi:hypothetical protein